MSRGKITISFKPEVFKQIEVAARARCMPVSFYVAELAEADAATRRLSTLPPCPKKPGGKPDLLERLGK